MTRNQFYTKRAAECLLASAQMPSERDVLLHMASVYIRMATDIEAQEDRRKIRPVGASTRNAA